VHGLLGLVAVAEDPQRDADQQRRVALAEADERLAVAAGRGRHLLRRCDLACTRSSYRIPLRHARRASPRGPQVVKAGRRALRTGTQDAFARPRCPDVPAAGRDRRARRAGAADGRHRHGPRAAAGGAGAAGHSAAGAGLRSGGGSARARAGDGHRLGLADRIALRQGEGLAALAEDEEMATVVIAGVGAQTVVAILAADRGAPAGSRAVVVQPNHGHAQVRRWLVDHDFERRRRAADRGPRTVLHGDRGRAGEGLGARAGRGRRGRSDRWCCAGAGRCWTAGRRPSCAAATGPIAEPGAGGTAERRALVAEALAQARAVEHPGPA
jgi:hypothetical protein